MKISIPIIAAGLLALGASGFAAEAPAASGAGVPPPASEKKGVTFDKDIKPIFDADCVSCHGAQRPSAGLRLNTLEAVLAGRQGRGGGAAQPVLKPGNSAESELVTAVARLNPRTAMPPPPRGARRGPGMGGNTNAPAGATNTPPAARGPQPKNLTAEEVGLVRAWIDQGAK